MNCGIYKIINLITGDFYVGQSIALKGRKRQHLYELRNNNHHNSHLQNSFDKHGEKSFIFEIVLYCEKIELTYYEQGLKDAGKDHCYNIRECVDSNKGIIPTEKTREKLSESHKGKVPWNKGILMTDEQKKNMFGAHIGNTNALGTKHSEESKEKMSIIKKDMSDETRQRMSDAKIGKPSNRKGVHLSKETKTKMSDAKRGKPSNRKGTHLSKETKTKISISAKNRIKKQKGYEDENTKSEEER